MPARIVTFGRMPETAPPGTFKRVEFPQLALLDQGTNEGFINRILTSDGGSTRTLPRTISYQDRDMPGHSAALNAGAIHEVTIDGESGIMSGRGWMADSDAGRDAAMAILSQSLYTNSVDLADIPHDGVEIIEHGSWWDDDFHVDIKFVEWAFAKTTLVGVPAFKDARATLPDELMASLESDEPLIVNCPSLFSGHSATEMVASMTSLPSWDYFHRPEADIPHKIMVGEPDEHGWCPVYGHLARWGQPHTGIDGRNVYAPRSSNDYARFCQPSVLTDKGMVRTGPMVLYGGHVSLREAADDPRNAWADVRVTDGRHGPWICGVARPHISHEDAERYVARASRISGHWKQQQLRMIISCNAEGIPIDFNPEADELVASFETGTSTPMPSQLLSFEQLDDEGQKAVLSWVQAASTSGTKVECGAAETLSARSDVHDDDGGFDAEAARLARERALALEAESA